MKTFITLSIAIIITLLSIIFAAPAIQFVSFACTIALTLFIFAYESFKALSDAKKSVVKLSTMIICAVICVLLTAFSAAMIYQCIAYIFTIVLFASIAYKELTK